MTILIRWKRNEKRRTGKRNNREDKWKETQGKTNIKIKSYHPPPTPNLSCLWCSQLSSKKPQSP